MTGKQAKHVLEEATKIVVSIYIVGDSIPFVGYSAFDDELGLVVMTHQPDQAETWIDPAGIAAISLFEVER